MKTKSAFALFKPSKDAVLDNLGPFLLFVFLPGFFIIIGDATTGTPALDFKVFTNPAANPQPFTAFHGIGVILSALLLPAGYYLELQAAKGKAMSIGSVFSDSMRYYWRLWGLLILMGLIILVGFLALIVPGIIFIRRYFLAPYFLLDRDLDIGAALKASAKVSKGHGGAIWNIIGVMVLLSLAGIIPILGGLISSLLLMLYACAPAMRYLELSPKNKHTSDKA